VWKESARLLLPDVAPIGDALAWAQRDVAAAAEELWVCEDILRVRLRVPTSGRAWLVEAQTEQRGRSADMRGSAIASLALIAGVLVTGCGGGGNDDSAASGKKSGEAAELAWRADLEKTLGYSLEDDQWTGWRNSVVKNCSEYGANAQQWADWQSPTLTPDFRTVLMIQGVRYACPKNSRAIQEGAEINAAKVPDAERACETPADLLSPLSDVGAC